MATQTQEIIQKLAPFQESYLKDIFASAKALQGVSQPYAPEQLAGLSEEQLQAVQLGTQGIGAYQPYMQAAAAMAAPEGYQAFMSPFTQQVIDQSMQDIARGSAMQQGQLAGQATGAGAFGGSRAAVASGELARGTMEQQARTAAQLRESGFGQAQQLAGQRSALFSGLGQLSQQLGTQDINTLLGLGGMTQQQSQAELDVARRNLLAQQALPFQQVGFMSDIFRGVPAMQSTYQTSTTPPPSTTSQLLGLGTAGIGALAQGGAFQGMFGS
ncbi:MAG: hypothetical protein CMQ07_00410 [Gammaproteobacteria bacterium]|nr:hypothetical protein [Gammaproteobacteria bacterium]